jgi:hypothetical protein
MVAHRPGQRLEGRAAHDAQPRPPAHRSADEGVPGGRPRGRRAGPRRRPAPSAASPAAGARVLLVLGPRPEHPAVARGLGGAHHRQAALNHDERLEHPAAPASQPVHRPAGEPDGPRLSHLGALAPPAARGTQRRWPRTCTSTRKLWEPTTGRSPRVRRRARRVSASAPPGGRSGQLPVDLLDGRGRQTVGAAPVTIPGAAG